MRRNNLEPPDSRRAFRRRAAIPCEIFTGRATSAFLALATDISLDGVGVVTTHPLLVGERVVVKLQPASVTARGLSVLAEAMHCGPALRGNGLDEEKIGLRFLYESERRRVALGTMLRALSARSSSVPSSVRPA